MVSQSIVHSGVLRALSREGDALGLFGGHNIGLDGDVANGAGRTRPGVLNGSPGVGLPGISPVSTCTRQALQTVSGR